MSFICVIFNKIPPPLFSFLQLIIQGLPREDTNAPHHHHVLRDYHTPTSQRLLALDSCHPSPLPDPDTNTPHHHHVLRDYHTPTSPSCITGLSHPTSQRLLALDSCHPSPLPDPDSPTYWGTFTSLFHHEEHTFYLIYRA